MDSKLLFLLFFFDKVFLLLLFYIMIFEWCIIVEKFFKCKFDICCFLFVLIYIMNYFDRNNIVVVCFCGF